MKIIKNCCYGGFSISPKAVKRLAELEGKKCYFFSGGLSEPYVPIEEPGQREIFWTAFSISNPNEALPAENTFKNLSIDDRKEYNKKWESVALTAHCQDRRTDPLLIQVVEELGKGANGRCADLKIVEIPDDIEYEIDEYDGIETIREKHRTW